MRRRTAIIGAAGLLGLGAVGFGASETGLLSSEPSSVTGTSSSPGTFSFATNGIDSVAWEADDSQHARLAVNYQSTPPDSFRLHRPDGRKIWENTAPSGTGDSKRFSLPVDHVGIWELVAAQNGSYASLQLPVANDFNIATFALRGDTVVFDIGNPTDSPNFIDYLRLTHAKTGRGQKYRVAQPLMPGDTYHREAPYPFDYYKGVELWVVGGTTDELTKQTKNFV